MKGGQLQASSQNPARLTLCGHVPADRAEQELVIPHTLSCLLSYGNSTLCVPVPSCPTAICPCKKSVSILFVSPLQLLEGRNEVSLEPCLLQAAQAQFLQSVFVGEVLQPSEHLCELIWTHSNSSPSLCWGCRPGCSTPGGASRGQSRGELSPPSPCWPSSFGQPKPTVYQATESSGSHASARVRK